MMLQTWRLLPGLTFVIATQNSSSCSQKRLTLMPDEVPHV
jgi:hypothetical protein